MARIVATGLLGFAVSLTPARLAGAEVAEVKLALQNGSNYLPLPVMQNQKLVLCRRGRSSDRSLGPGD